MTSIFICDLEKGYDRRERGTAVCRRDGVVGDSMLGLERVSWVYGELKGLLNKITNVSYAFNKGVQREREPKEQIGRGEKET